MTCPPHSRGLPADLTGYVFFNWAAEFISLSVNCLQAEPHVLPHEESSPWRFRVGEASEVLQGPLSLWPSSCMALRRPHGLSEMSLPGQSADWFQRVLFPEPYCIFLFVLQRAGVIRQPVWNLIAT